MAILIGVFLGLCTLAFIGPVFFYLVKSSFTNGFKAGIAVALGILLGDSICVALAFFGASDFFDNTNNQQWIAFIGGIILMIIGIQYLVKPKLTAEFDEKYSTKKTGKFFINGFLINFFNPFVFLVWFGYATYSRSKLDTEREVLIALIFALITIFTTDILKALFAERLLKLINPKVLKIVFRVFGLIMIGFAIRLILVVFL